MVLFIFLYKVVLTFKSVVETLVCDHSTESYLEVISCGTVYDNMLLVICGSKVKSMDYRCVTLS